MLATATASSFKSFVIRTVHGDSMEVSQDLLQRWADFRRAQREKTAK